MWFICAHSILLWLECSTIRSKYVHKKFQVFICRMWPLFCPNYTSQPNLWPKGIVVIMSSVCLSKSPCHDNWEGNELGSPNLVRRYLSWKTCLRLYVGHLDPLSRSHRSTLWIGRGVFRALPGIWPNLWPKGIVVIMSSVHPSVCPNLFATITEKGMS